jgi:hypothetical protein
VATGIYRRSGLGRIKVRHVYDYHGVDATVEKSFVSHQPGKPSRFIHTKPFAGLIHLFGKAIRQGMNLESTMPLEKTSEP